MLEKRGKKAIEWTPKSVFSFLFHQAKIFSEMK